MQWQEEWKLVVQRTPTRREKGSMFPSLAGKMQGNKATKSMAIPWSSSVTSATCDSKSRMVSFASALIKLFPRYTAVSPGAEDTALAMARAPWQKKGEVQKRNQHDSGRPNKTVQPPLPPPPPTAVLFQPRTNGCKPPCCNIKREPNVPSSPRLLFRKKSIDSW